MPSHLTAAERDRIAQLTSEGANQNEVAADLQRSPATISRELRRNAKGDRYHACAAQQLAESRRSERPLERKLDDAEVESVVRKLLVRNWSPEQIAGRLKLVFPDRPKFHVSAPTIYEWIKNHEDSSHWKAFLRRRGKPRRNRKKPAEGECRSRIDNRPDEIESRVRIGDFEGDTVLGPPGTGGVVTLVDRKSGYTIVTKISSKDANHVHARVKLRLKELSEERRRSITFDNGSEFARCHRLEKHLGLKLYFADPGCPYQRGTNENTNGLIRQYYPKGTDFRNVSHEDVRTVEKLLNDRPRERHEFLTPNEIFFEKRPRKNCV